MFGVLGIIVSSVGFEDFKDIFRDLVGGINNKMLRIVRFLDFSLNV